MKRALLDALLQAREEKRPAVVLTWLETGRQQLLLGAPGGGGDLAPVSGEPPPPPAALAAARQGVRSDRSATVDVEGAPVFVRVFNPPLRMHVIGAVHITQALAPMAELAGYEVTVIDPRRAFASDRRFPGIRVETDWPDEVLERIGIDARTAVVALTHDPKIDDPGLELALRSPAFYIGALGSRRTHARRCERLAERGFDEAATARIHGPIGLDIGARSPAEIAVAILAEVTRALRAGPEKA